LRQSDPAASDACRHEFVQKGSETCPISTMMDCVKMVERAEKVVTF